MRLPLLFLLTWRSNADFATFKFIQCTNYDIKDTACLHVVHFLQPPTSRPTTKSTQDTLVNAPRKNLSPLLAGKFSKLTLHPTRWRHQMNEGNSSLEIERVWTLGELCCLWSKKKLSAENRWETHFLSNQGKEKWIKDHVDRVIAEAREQI